MSKEEHSRNEGERQKCKFNLSTQYKCEGFCFVKIGIKNTCGSHNYYYQFSDSIIKRKNVGYICAVVCLGVNHI